MLFLTRFLGRPSAMPREGKCDMLSRPSKTSNDVWKSQQNRGHTQHAPLRMGHSYDWYRLSPLTMRCRSTSSPSRSDTYLSQHEQTFSLSVQLQESLRGLYERMVATYSTQLMRLFPDGEKQAHDPRNPGCITLRMWSHTLWLGRWIGIDSTCASVSPLQIPLT